MAQQQPSAQSSLSGAEHIRSLQDDDSVFKAFDSYPWKKDTAFMSGLNAILGDPNADNPQGSASDMATHARIFYYAQRIGVSIDFAAYQSWLTSHPDHSTPDILPEEYTNAAERAKGKQPGAPAPTLSWQQAAPKADLWIDKKAAAQQAATSDAAGQPSYPMAFAEMIKLLQEGKPIPGIRQIPNTVVRDPSVKPIGSRPAPRKPWEKDIEAAAPEHDIAKTLDSDFPPIESAEVSTPSEEPVQA